MIKKVLITGATGFVGYHLIEHAIADGLDVYAAIRKSSDVSHLKHFGISYLELEYSDVNVLIKALEDHQFHYIIHAAGSTKAKTKADYDLVNATYTRNLAQASSTAKFKLEKFIFVSSLAALGPLDQLSLQLQDSAAGHPVTNYGASKLLAEEHLKAFQDLPLITLRPTAVYGPREKDLFILFKTISQGLEPYIGNFKQQLSFIYVKDLARLIVGALTSDITHQTYNVADGHTYDRYALALHIRKALNRKTLRFHIPIRLIAGAAALMDWIYRNKKSTPTLNKEKMAELTAINWACSIEHLEQDLDFHPQYNLEQGIAETVQWYQQNGWL